MLRLKLPPGADSKVITNRKGKRISSVPRCDKEDAFWRPLWHLDKKLHPTPGRRFPAIVLRSWRLLNWHSIISSWDSRRIDTKIERDIFSLHRFPIGGEDGRIFALQRLKVQLRPGHADQHPFRRNLSGDPLLCRLLDPRKFDGPTV